jgi:hypothetical protein
MKAVIALSFISLILLLSNQNCKKSEMAILSTGEYLQVVIPTKFSIDSCGCNDPKISTIRNKEDTLTIIHDKGFINIIQGSIFKFSKVCNLPLTLLDTSQNKKYLIIYSGEEFLTCKPHFGPSNYIYTDIILTKLSIKLK